MLQIGVWRVASARNVRLIGGAGMLTNAIESRNVEEPSSDFSLTFGGDIDIEMLPELMVAFECPDYIT